ncbi:hypothetical protein Syun_012443 [Stephania yunnanensis]|uniref:Uncharacterized protein n=1 Tax=Stephania yunnanensis TaxID=152371 RepID=A0AAP0K0U1_9MAGN
MATIYLRYELLSGRRRYLPIECMLGALILVRGYLIVARVRAGRQVYRPKAKSTRLLPRLKDLLRLWPDTETKSGFQSSRDRVRDPVECTDKDIDLVVYRDKDMDMDMFHLDWDFNVYIWAYGQPGTADPETYECYCRVRWCVLCLEVSEEPSSSRRSPACRGGAQPYRVRWGYGLGRVWPWAGMALDLHS